MAVVTLEQAKKHLNIETAVADDQLPGFIAAAEAIIAGWVGPLEAVGHTVRVAPVGSCLRVFPSPAISITSVTDSNGAAVTVGDLYLSKRAGLITFSDGRSFTASWYDVTYQAGRATCPADLVQAVKEMVRHLWTSQRGNGGRGGGSDFEPGEAYTLPNRVRELIGPHRIQMVG